jgi:hypothetical protein
MDEDITNSQNQRFNSKRVSDRNIDELIGLARGILADGKVDQQEAEYLQKWLIAISVSIDSTNKKARTNNNWIAYKESGNEVSWSSLFSFKPEDTISMGHRYRLNRVTGQLEQDFMTKKFQNGIKPEDYDVIRDVDNYDWGLMHTADCKKVEAIF